LIRFITLLVVSPFRTFLFKPSGLHPVYVTISVQSVVSPSKLRLIDLPFSPLLIGRPLLPETRDPSLCLVVYVHGVVGGWVRGCSAASFFFFFSVFSLFYL